MARQRVRVSNLRSNFSARLRAILRILNETLMSRATGVVCLGRALSTAPIGSFHDSLAASHRAWSRAVMLPYSPCQA
jgi:hypothetical protein